jgi:hypothetical protein
MVRVDPIIVFWVDFDLWQRLELALVEGRHIGFGRAEGGEMGFRLF